MVRFWKGCYRELDPEQLEALAGELLYKRASASKAAARLGFGDNLDRANLADQLETVGYEPCPVCYVWVRGDELVFEWDGLLPTLAGCVKCVEARDEREDT